MSDAMESLPSHTNIIRKAAKEAGRRVRTIINPMIVCRPTENEAFQYRDAILDAADIGAVDGFAHVSRSGDAVGWRNAKRHNRALGGNLHIVGSPEQIVEHFIRLKNAGCDGLQLTFYDFAPNLEYFGNSVLPLMYQVGLRVDTNHNAGK